jgi:N-acetylglucosaminyldiphosphoundecaprenol N-acetyl-beta-D-mannosaminyltransferase
MTDPTLPSRTSVLGIQVSRTTYAETSDIVLRAAASGTPLTVSALAVHGLMTGVLDSTFGRTLNEFDILTPDGQPLRWALNIFGAPRLRDRVYGPTLMLHICERAAREGIGVFLFGSRQEVIDRLAANLQRRFPKLAISGRQADRFRAATPDEDAGDMRRIGDSGAGIVFCGRGCPRQERWCHEHRGRIPGALVAVGAAFDFHAGTLLQAPDWMQRAGLEWLFRLSREPRRLWRRYLLLNPLFLLGVLSQAAGVSWSRPLPPPR